MKLFIGNLSFNTTESTLREAFEPFEPILEYIRPRDRETGKPRGFAFVTLVDRDQGEKAIEKLDGMELDGRNLRVNEAEDRRQFTPAEPRVFRDELDDGPKTRVDDRPVGKNGKKVVYKSI